MTINEFLQMYNEKMLGTEMNKVRPRVKCKDGFTVSVQAGYGMYSHPARFSTYFSHVELGYPDAAEDDWAPYAESEAYTQTVYAQVPVEDVDRVLNRHGGIVGPDFSNCNEGLW